MKPTDRKPYHTALQSTKPGYLRRKFAKIERDLRQQAPGSVSVSTVIPIRKK